MYGKIMTVWTLALRNLSRQRFQSILLFVILLITSVSLFFSEYLLKSMREGLQEAKERLGADLIVVPDRFVSNIEDALFVGKPCTVNFDKKWLTKIAGIKGVDRVSFQLYIASLSMDCCESSLQLIAFDMKSDFVVAPWLSKDGINRIADDEIILGRNMKKKVGGTVKYYGRKFTVIEVLDETGMGYDNCAFISYEAAYDIANDPNYEGILPFGKKQKVISMVLVKLKEDESIIKVKEDILSQYGDSEIAVYSTSDLVSRFADNLDDFAVYGGIFKALLLILATASLYGIYRITIHLRKAEFGTFFSFGTGRRTILSVLIAEMLVLVIASTQFGIGLVCLFTIPFHEAFKTAFHIPYLMPSGIDILAISLKTLAVNSIVCILASIKSFYELAHLDGIHLIKTNNE